MVSPITEKRSITKEDIFLKTRLRAEGARIEFRRSPQRHAIVIVLDGCDVLVGILQNPRSLLEVVIDGADVTIREMSKVLATATVEPQAPWHDMRARNGDFSLVANYINAVNITSGCYVCSIGKGCRYCDFGPMFIEMDSARQLPPLPSISEVLSAMERQIEAFAIAARNGWRGLFLLAGGAAPPERRDKWTTDMVEAVMNRLHESIDESILAEIQIATDVYPPDDLGELYKWKSFGITSTEFDCQVMDPAYFSAVCPGREEQKRWYEAQEAAAEVFGRGRGSISNLVSGIEPIDGMLEGIEERMSKGVFILAPVFNPNHGSPMRGMLGATAEWYVEAAEKMADIYLRYADTFDVDLTEDARWGYTRLGQSWPWYVPASEEMVRRLQEMGKLPPGLPKQDGIALA